MSESAPVVKARCPACNKKLGFPEASVGKKARCSGCQHIFRVEVSPDPAQAPKRVTPVTPPTSDLLTMHCPSCNKKLRFPLSASGRKAKCPGCEEKFTVSPQQPLAEPSARVEPPPPAPKAADDGNDLYDFLADAEKNAQALEEQPPPPEDFKAPEFPTPKPDSQERSATAGARGKSAPRDKETSASVMERAYGTMGALGKGCALSAAGALIGAFIWYGIAKGLSIEVGYVALGVGVLAGLGMHLGFKNESIVAGLLAACFAFGGIVAGKLMYVAWVVMPGIQADIRKEANDVENQRELLVTLETEKILKSKNLNPENSTEEQDEAAEAEAHKRIAALKEPEVRQRYEQYMAQHPEAKSDPSLMPVLKAAPTGLLVLGFGLLFGIRGLFFLIIGMVTAFKVGYNGGRFSQ
jgi:hypothetical protein